MERSIGAPVAVKGGNRSRGRASSSRHLFMVPDRRSGHRPANAGDVLRCVDSGKRIPRRSIRVADWRAGRIGSALRRV